MKQFLFFFLPTFAIIFMSCSDYIEDDKKTLPPSSYETIVGNTYVNEDGSPVKYSFYTFKEDGTIDVQVRVNYLDGELVDKSIGYYEYSHPILKLKINSGCPNCFNNYEAKVHDYRTSFTIKLLHGWDRSFFVYDYYYDTTYKLKPKY